MNYSYPERLKFIFKYTDSIFQNILLTLLLITFVLCLFKLFGLFRLSGRSRPSPRKNTALLYLFFIQLVLYTVISTALTGASSVGIKDQLIVGKDFYSLQNVSKARSTGTINKVSTSTYISKVSLNNPQKNWKKKIHNGTSESAAFLGETNKGIFYQSNGEIEGINKKTGEKILTSEQLIKKNPQLKNVLSSDGYRYRLSEKENQLFFETTIGDQYQLDLKSLNAQKLSEDFNDFGDQDNGTIEKSLQAVNMKKSLEFTTTISSNDPRFPYLSFFSNKTIQEAEAVKKFSVAGPNLNAMDIFDKMPKYLYGFGYSEETSQLSLTKVAEEKWIDPHFLLIHSSDRQTNTFSIIEGLTKKNILDKTSERIITVPHDDFFGSMADQFAVELLKPKFPSTPLLIGEENLLIVHSEANERDSKLLLSLWDVKKNETRWTIKTNSTSLIDYAFSDNSLVFTIDSNSGSNQLIIIDTKTGQGKGYDFKYNDVFKVVNL